MSDVEKCRKTSHHILHRSRPSAANAGDLLQRVKFVEEKNDSQTSSSSLSLSPLVSCSGRGWRDERGMEGDDGEEGEVGCP